MTGNVKSQTIELIKKNTGKVSCDFKLDKDFLYAFKL